MNANTIHHNENPDDALEMSHVARSKDAARASYNKLSKWYDLIAGGSEKKFREIGLEKLNVGAGESVLEIGCGTGHSLMALAQKAGPSGRVYGIDLSEGMLEQALDRLSKNGLAKRVELQCGDAAHLPYPADSFDAIFISFTLELFDTPELPLVMRECRRVLRHDGRVIVVALSKKKGPAVGLYEWFHIRFPNYVDCRPIYVRYIIAEAGFRITEVIELVMWGLPVDIVLARKEQT